MPVPVTLLAAVSTADAEACGDKASAACLFVYRRTHNDVLARTADWLIARPLKILLILALAMIASRVIRGAIDRFVSGLNSTGANGSLLVAAPLGLRARARAETLAAIMRSLARAVIWTMAGLTILSEFNINLGPLLAGAGIVGVAIGFGAQTLVKDFLSGVFMLIEDQFGVGDLVDTGQATGVVEGIGLRTTRVRDDQGVIWHIPNGSITRIGNKSQGTTTPG